MSRRASKMTKHSAINEEAVSERLLERGICSFGTQKA